jgi:GH35 family endo-1,4-beta-xylanase
MKIKNTISFFLVAVILVSCAPVATAIPTEITIPTPIFTAISSTPTITPTPTPENIKDAKDLSVWIQAYVHAYGDKVIVNGMELNAEQLTDEIIKNETQFFQRKKINESEYLFLVVNDVPLAIRQESVTDAPRVWNQVHLKTIGDMLNLPIGSENRITPNFFDELSAATVNAEWYYMNPREDFYDWNRLDKQIAQLQQGGISPAAITLHGFNFNNPAQWVIDKNPSVEEIRLILTNHITRMIEYGKTKGINMYTIINEPYAAITQNSYFYEKLGDEYFTISFLAARKADPNAYLILNETNSHYGLYLPNSKQIDKTNPWYLTYSIAEKLRETKVDGKPILNAVGFQMHTTDMHWYPNQDKVPSGEEVFETVAYFKDLGIDIIVTEFDYDMHNFAGTPQEKLSKQAEYYYQWLDAVLDVGISQITFWDIDDESTWLKDNGIMDGMSTMFNYGTPKPAYYSALKALYEHLP